MCFKKCFNSQQDGYGPQSLGQAYRPVGTSESEHVDFRQQFLQQSNQKNMEEAEDVDVNAGIHGALLFNGHGPIYKLEWRSRDVAFRVSYMRPSSILMYHF